MDSLSPLGGRLRWWPRDANHLDIFVVGEDGHVYTTWWNSSLPGWASITGAGGWENLGGREDQ